MGDWTFTKEQDGLWDQQHFITEAEAIDVGVRYAKKEAWDSLYIGQVRAIPIPSMVDAEDTIERVSVELDSKYGEHYEPGIDFLDNLGDGDTERLQELLNEAFRNWVTERQIKCPGFIIENVNQIVLRKG